MSATRSRVRTRREAVAGGRGASPGARRGRRGVRRATAPEHVRWVSTASARASAFGIAARDAVVHAGGAREERASRGHPQPRARLGRRRAPPLRAELAGGVCAGMANYADGNGDTRRYAHGWSTSATPSAWCAARAGRNASRQRTDGPVGGCFEGHTFPDSVAGRRSRTRAGTCPTRVLETQFREKRARKRAICVRINSRSARTWS